MTYLDWMQLAIFRGQAFDGGDGGPVQRADLDEAGVDGAIDDATVIAFKVCNECQISRTW